MDLKETSIESLKNIHSLLTKDLDALPEEAFTREFGPECRMVADIVYEINLVNEHVRQTVCGEQPFEWPSGGWPKAPGNFNSKSAIIEAFNANTAKLLTSLEAFTEDQFEAPIKIENGETNLFERCRFMTVHMWYHSGQFNFIQTLLGDTDWHW